MKSSPNNASNNFPVGVLLFGRKRPGFDQEWSSEIRRRCCDALTGLGYNVIGADKIVMDDDSIYSALAEFDRTGCRALVIVQPSLADGQYAFTVSQRWRDPIVLWATPERPGDGKVSSCSLVGQNLWSSILRQSRHPFEFVYGAPEDVGHALTQAIGIGDTVKRLRTAKLGVVGAHAPGFVDLAADPFLIRKTFGAQLHALSLPQFIDRVRAIPADAVQIDLESIRALGLGASEDSDAELSDDLLSVNSRYYLAIRELMRETNLDALALQCWPELPIVLDQWPYFAVSRLGAEGNAVSIEGDVDAALGALIGRMLGIGPGFLTDWLEHDQSSIFFWHPGMAPLDMCNEVGTPDQPSLGKHFNGAKPFVVDGALQIGSDVTISRIWRCDNRYHWTAFEGTTVPPRRRVTGNSVLVEVDGGGVPERFDRLIHAGLPHHVTLHFGRHAETFRRMARMFDTTWHD